MTHHILFGRRDALAGLAGAGLLAATQRARAAGGSLVVANWGGDWNDRTVKFVEAPLVESKGYHIDHILTLEPERKTKLVSEARFHRGTIDVVHLNDADAYEMNHQGVLATLDQQYLPNYADTVTSLRQPYFVPWLYSAVVIVCNAKAVKEPPKSFAELWDKKWAGRLGLTTQLYFMYVMMAGLVKDGSTTSADAKAKLEELKRLTSPRIYATHQTLQAGLANGEIDITVEYKARGAQFANGGIPLAMQYPKEGAIAITFGAGLPKTAPDPTGAYVYLNALLDPKAMGELAAASFYAPANTKAPLSPELRDKIDFSEAEQKSLRFPDRDHVAKNTADWLEFWNKTIAS